MRITQDLHANEILGTEHLLEGFNYSVWVNTYGPFDLNRTLEEQLAHSTGNEVIIGGQSCVTSSEARSEVTEQLLHVGDGGVDFQVVQMYDHGGKAGRKFVSRPGRQGVGEKRQKE